VILLDPHAWIWLNFNDPRLSYTAREAIAEADTLAIAAISLWEVGMLTSKNRIELPQPLLSWLLKACEQPNLRLLPITPEVAAVSTTIPVHGDPADRLIIATALQHACPIVTIDENIQSTKLVQTIW